MKLTTAILTRATMMHKPLLVTTLIASLAACAQEPHNNLGPGNDAHLDRPVPALKGETADGYTARTHRDPYDIGGPLYNPGPAPLTASNDDPGYAPSPPPASGRSEIVLHGEGGAFTVPVSINGAITLQFTIDSGAADVSIPVDVVLTLMRTGTIGHGDFLGNRTYMLADGSTAPSPTFRIRTLKVGDREVHDVVASIAPVKGSLLLGQSFLKHFGSWSIDNQRGVLVLA
jgi:hypothetical protein